MANASHAAPPPTAGEKPAGGSKKLMIVILASVMGLIVVGGGVFLFRDKIFGSGKTEDQAEEPVTVKKKSAAAKEATEEEEAAPASKKKKRKILEAAGVAALEPFTVNLQDADTTRYMRLVISLGLDNANLAKEAGENAILKARVRDVVMRYITTLTTEQVLSKEGKEKLLETIIERTNEVLEEAVIDVYIQELIVQ